MKAERNAAPDGKISRPRALFGGITRRVFLRDYWRRRPLLVRGALDPSVARIADLASLRRLAAREDVESRLVEIHRGRWHVRHGPIARDDYPVAAARRWTLLVNGANHHIAGAQQLLERFAFLSWARIDDVMASYAVPGGGVGPHVDSYDVFLVQGRGRRRWRIASPRAFELVESAPLRLIRDFQSEEEYVLAPGDMLYLPPGWGHDGVALEACTTLSVGFRAPRADELGAAFLDWLHEHRLPEGAQLAIASGAPGAPGEIHASIVNAAAAVLRSLRPSAADESRFIGEYLSTPKPHVVFRAPRRPLPPAAFARALAHAGIVLDPKSILLYRGGLWFLNGEAVAPPRALRPFLRTLADTRRAAGWPAGSAALLHDWYRAGFILFPGRPRARPR